ncbi:hypothetical protein ACFUJX_20230 [Streptomyces rubiginosohelvolus]|uniref:hypothetical protein n=1 Tax=Streptomyces rubiginosohelvolus TaxID=67362 RepID=UPI003635E04E
MNQPTAGERILAFLDTVFTEQEQALAPLVGLGTCPDWGHCQPECTHQFGINDAEAKLRRVAAERKIVNLHRPVEMVEEMADACTVCEVTGNYPYYPCATLRLLAEGYGWTEDGR